MRATLSHARKYHFAREGRGVASRVVTLPLGGLSFESTWIHVAGRDRADRSVRPREDEPRWRPKGWRRRGWGSSWTEGAILLIKTPVINGGAPHDLAPYMLARSSLLKREEGGGRESLRWKRSRVKAKWGKNWGWRIRGKKKGKEEGRKNIIGRFLIRQRIR